MAIINDDNTGGLVAGATASSDTIFGNGGDDIINASGGSDTIIGGSGRDELYGEAGNDIFVYRQAAASDWVAGEIIDGGANTDRMQVDGVFDFRNGTIRSIEIIEFKGLSPFANNSAILLAEQFSSTGIATSARFIGVAGDKNSLQIKMGTKTAFDASQFTFQSWSASDTLQITGDGSDETITLSRVRDTVNSGSGADTIKRVGSGDSIVSGSGNDTIEITGVLTGSTINGGADTDTLVIAGETTDVTASTVTSIEKIVFADTEQSISYLYVDPRQFSTTGISTSLQVHGSNAFDLLYFFANNADTLPINVNLGSATVSNFNGDRVDFRGTSRDDNFQTFKNAPTSMFGNAGDDTLTGSNFADFIDGGQDRDEMFGLEGNDFFETRLDDYVAGEVFDGGMDSDTLFLNVGTYDLSLAELRSIETLDLSGQGNIAVVLGGAQVGLGALATDILIATRDYDNLHEYTLDFQLGVLTSIDLSSVRFENWVTSLNITGDRVLITGSTSDDTIVGSIQSDIITGDNGADRLTGGTGKDRLSGGAGADTFIFTALLDSTSGTNRDIIADFETGIDHIDVSAIDANEMTTANDTFVLNTNGTLDAGEYQIRVAGNSQVIDFNADNDAEIELQIQVTGTAAVTAGVDFIL